MTWTYDGTPGTDTAAKRRDAVRVLVGDTDTNDQQIQDEEIEFALSQNSKNVYFAAAQTARMIMGLYSRRVDSDLEGVSADYSDRIEHYRRLAVALDKQAKSKGGALGTPKAGGISIDAMESAKDDSDRPDPAFKRNQFKNPPDTTYDDYWRQK
jgi:hypothetical protein